MKTARRVLPLACLLLGACTFLEPRADPTRYFVLTPEAPPLPVGDAQLTVVIGPVQLPDYLLRPEIVLRAGPNQLEPSRVDRWAEPIDRALLRVLCLDVAALLPRSSVLPFPANVGKGALGVEIEIVSFEADRSGMARLEGHWSLRDGPEGAHAFKLERSAGGAETAEVVGAMSGLVAELAGQIASELSASAAARPQG